MPFWGLCVLRILSLFVVVFRSVFRRLHPFGDYEICESSIAIIVDRIYLMIIDFANRNPSLFSDICFFFAVHLWITSFAIPWLLCCSVWFPICRLHYLYWYARVCARACVYCKVKSMLSIAPGIHSFFAGRCGLPASVHCLGDIAIFWWLLRSIWGFWKLRILNCRLCVL